MKKFFSKIVLLVLIFCLFPTISVKAQEGDAGTTVTMKYDTLESLPNSLPNCDQIKVKPEHKAYLEGIRNVNLGQFVSTQHKCMLTFSIPEMKGFSEQVIEKNDTGSPEPHTNRILMVTAEYLTPNDYDVIAESYLYIFNPEDNPTLCITFIDDMASVGMENYVTYISFFARKAQGKIEWTDEWAKKPIKAKTYQSDGYSMYDYATWGTAEGGDNSFVYNYGEVEMTYNKRKQLLDNIKAYNTYLSNKEKKEAWYNDHLKYWTKEDYSSFKLDDYVKSLGGTITTVSEEVPNYKVINLNGNTITIGCFSDDECYDQWGVHVFSINNSWVSWDEEGYKCEKDNIKFDTHCYKLRSGEYPPVKVDDNLYSERWDFDFLLSLLDHCATQN